MDESLQINLSSDLWPVLAAVTPQRGMWVVRLAVPGQVCSRELETLLPIAHCALGWQQSASGHSSPQLLTEHRNCH